MHYHCEIVIPPVVVADPEDYVRAAVSAIMSPFDESRDEQSGEIAFWDWWVIGGRWAGKKLMERLGKERIDAFYQWVKSEGITVSSFQFGKEELMPADQIPKVDAKWNEEFLGTSGGGPVPCADNPDKRTHFLVAC